MGVSSALELALGVQMHVSGIRVQGVERVVEVIVRLE